MCSSLRFTFNTLVQAALRYLNCTTISVQGQAKYINYFYPAVECDSAGYRAYLPLAIAVLIWEVAIVPAVLAVVLISGFAAAQGRPPEDSGFARVFDFLYALYNRKMYLYEFF